MFEHRIRLHLLPVEVLILHEESEPQRVAALRQLLLHSGLLHHPPLIAPLDGERYLVLDGATRVSAFVQLGIPTIVAQVVDYPSAQVQLQTWTHLLPHFTLNQLAQLALECGLIPRELSAAEAHEALVQRRALASVRDLHGHGFVLEVADSNAEFVGLLRAFVHRYRRTTLCERISPEEQELFLRHRAWRTALLITFPPLTPEEIRSLALRGQRLPAGVTRHIIAGRLLYADIPLDALRRLTPLEVQRHWFQQWWQERLRHHRLRYYPEPTFVLDG